MWLSFDLMRDAFVAAATAPFCAAGSACVYSQHGEVSSPPASPPGRITSFKLLRLTETSAMGAAWKGAKDVGAAIPLDHAALTEVLFAWP